MWQMSWNGHNEHISMQHLKVAMGRMKAHYASLAKSAGFQEETKSG
jgi:hypothetical protein